MYNLFLNNNQQIAGNIFGKEVAASSGEVVFTTNMSGYPETITDPSFYGQIIVFTFPLLGNYGIPQETMKDKKTQEYFESNQIWANGIIISEKSEIIADNSRGQNLSEWLREEKTPGLEIADTRALTQLLREHGTVGGTISQQKPPKKWSDVDKGRYIPMVSPSSVSILHPNKPNGQTVALIDCGAKHGIIRALLNYGFRVLRCPFDCDPLDLGEKIDGILISNGPGDPTTAIETIIIIKGLIQKAKVPILGICMGHQLLALAGGAKTKKMRYGHRGANQPVQNQETEQCLITSQNHGYEIDAKTLPVDFKPWFIHLHDQCLEGIKHTNKPIFSVQFHPEACPGPKDAEVIWKYFIDAMK